MVSGAPESIENLVIVGSGPAGYTAAIYAARANLQPILVTGFQRGGIPGGQLMTTTHVENFPGFPDGVLGPDLMDLMKAQAVRWGTHLLEADADSIDLSQRPFQIQVEGETIRAHAVVIATGASANRLGLPSEEKFWSRGISACAICDGATPQFRNAELAVVGGGDSACEEATFLTRFASKVTLIHRREVFKASTIMYERAANNDKIEIRTFRQVKEWLSDDNGLTGAILEDPRDGSTEEISATGAFIAIGHKPITGFLGGQVETDENGYIIHKQHTMTSVEGVFAAGDVVDTRYKQAITAAGMGCQAAIDAEKWLEENLH